MSDLKPLPEAATLTISWPSMRPFDTPVSAAGVQEAWDAVVKPLADDGPQSVEVRILMAIVRSVYAGMHGVDVDGEALP